MNWAPSRFHVLSTQRQIDRPSRKVAIAYLQNIMNDRIDYSVYLVAVDYSNRFYTIHWEPFGSHWWDSLPIGIQRSHLISLGYYPGLQPNT